MIPVVDCWLRLKVTQPELTLILQSMMEKSKALTVFRGESLHVVALRSEVLAPKYLERSLAASVKFRTCTDPLHRRNFFERKRVNFDNL